MLTPERLDRLQRRLEFWDRPGNPISVNTGLELVELARKGLEAERLEREADWLAHNVGKGCPPLPPERLPDCDNEEHPHDCASCWRKVAGEAVEESLAPQKPDA